MRLRAALLLCLTLAAGTALGWPRSADAGPEAVDLELVLAVDVSRSMDPEEQRVQREGYVEAFRHDDVVGAIKSGTLGKIAVVYVEWSGPEAQLVVVPWTTIDGDASAGAFANLIEAQPLSRLSSTSISAALLFSANLFAARGGTASRRAIDVSGDGPNTSGMPLVTARAAVLAKGITINGLPIMLRGHDPSGLPSLDDYYRTCVIGGPDAFAVTVTNIGELTAAIRKKLVLEISRAADPDRPTLIRTAGLAMDCGLGDAFRP